MKDILFSVTIDKRYVNHHSSYAQIVGCPLYNAIKDQHPEFELLYVGGWSISDINEVQYTFDEEQWNDHILNAIRDGNIQSISLPIFICSP